MESDEAAALIGATIDRYELGEVLGAGGFGTVYRARHVVLDQSFAVKILHPHYATRASVAQRFLREAKAAAAIGNPHIVRVTDAGVSGDGFYFLAMELLRGRGLDEIFEREAPLDVDRALRLTKQILTGLGAAHERDIVHRDLKPANVFVTQDTDGSEVAKILDFGISRIQTPGLESDLTREGMILGSPRYMAPEQFASSAVDARADLYAVACILYQALSGALPFEATRLDELFHAVQRGQATPLSVRSSALSPALCAVVERGLSRDPDGRWPSATQMLEAIAAVERGEPMTPDVTLEAPTSRAPDARAATPHTRVQHGVATRVGYDTPPRAAPDARALPSPSAEPTPTARRRRWWLAGAALAAGIVAMIAIAMVSKTEDRDLLIADASEAAPTSQPVAFSPTDVIAGDESPPPTQPVRVAVEAQANPTPHFDDPQPVAPVAPDDPANRAPSAMTTTRPTATASPAPTPVASHALATYVGRRFRGACPYPDWRGQLTIDLNVRPDGVVTDVRITTTAPADVQSCLRSALTTGRLDTLSLEDAQRDRRGTVTVEVGPVRACASEPTGGSFCTAW